MNIMWLNPRIKQYSALGAMRDKTRIGMKLNKPCCVKKTYPRMCAKVDCRKARCVETHIFKEMFFHQGFSEQIFNSLEKKHEPFVCKDIRFTFVRRFKDCMHKICVRLLFVQLIIRALGHTQCQTKAKASLFQGGLLIPSCRNVSLSFQFIFRIQYTISLFSYSSKY